MSEQYRINDDIAWREVDGQILILDTLETQSAHELNPMASFIFEMIHQGYSTLEIQNELLKEFKDSNNEDLIKDDLNQFLKELSDRKIILS